LKKANTGNLKRNPQNKNLETFKMSATIPNLIAHKEPVNNDENLDAGDFDEIKYNDKTKVECICPKCGQKHKMSFHWIGRGTPRKYCPACKGSN